MFAKVLAVLSVGSVLFLLPRVPAQPVPQDGGFTLSRVVLQNCEVDIRPKPRPMTVMVDYGDVLDETAKTYTVTFDIAVPTSDKVYVGDGAAGSNVQLKAHATNPLTALNHVTLVWNFGTTPSLSLKLENGTSPAPLPIAQTLQGSYDRLKLLSVSAYEVRRWDANPDKRRIRVDVAGCGFSTSFTLSDS